jgi:heat shock protein HslJ
LRRRSVFAVLAVATLLAAAAACGRPEGDAVEATRKDGTVSPGDFIDYEGPQAPKDTEWLLRSLNGDDAAEGSDIFLVHDEKQLGVAGGCMGFDIVHEIEGDRIRVVQPGLQVGRFGCGKSEEVRRQAEGVLDIMLNLAQVRATENAFELTSESGGVAAFVPPAPARVDPALVGTEWLLVSLNGHGPLPGPRPTLEIEEEYLGGATECNGFGGAIDRMSGGTLEWGSGPTDGFSSSTVGCFGAVGRQEREFQDALAGAASYRLDGERLELRNAEGRTTAAFEEKTRLNFDPAVLEETRWRLRSVDGEEPVEGSIATVEFGEGQEASWYDGCESASGRYAVTDYELVFTQEGTVEGECMKPERLANPTEPCVQVCFYPSGNYRMRDGLLEVRSDTEGKTAVLEPLAEGKELNRDGTPWELRAFVEDGRETRVRGGQAITLTFDGGTLRDEGTLFGSTGCNDYRVAYEYPIIRSGLDQMIVDDPAVTKRKCAPRAAAENEGRFLGILRDVSYYPAELASGRMSLETEDGRKLVFSATEQAYGRSRP